MFGWMRKGIEEGVAEGTANGVAEGVMSALQGEKFQSSLDELAQRFYDAGRADEAAGRLRRDFIAEGGLGTCTGSNERECHLGRTGHFNP